MQCRTNRILRRPFRHRDHRLGQRGHAPDPLEPNVYKSRVAQKLGQQYGLELAPCRDSSALRANLATAANPPPTYTATRAPPAEGALHAATYPGTDPPDLPRTG